MREIKFRAWDGERLKNVRSMGWVEDEMEYIGTPKYNAPAEEFKLMQFTGLRDYHDTDIYEADVLQYDKNQTVLVHYHEATASFIASYIMHCDEYGDLKGGWIGSEPFDMRNIENRKMKVIGNAYEDPELLKSMMEFMLKKHYPHVLGDSK